MFGSILSTQVSAQGLKLLAGGGIELGGDELYELFFTNGESTIGRAGQGGFIDLGAQYQVPSAPKLLFRGTIGYKFLLNPTENARTRITRFPLTFSTNWMATEDIRLSLGVSKHLSAQVVGDGFVEDKDLESTWGPRIEAGWKGITLSYTIMDYTDQNNEVFSANAFGISYNSTINFKKREN